MSAAHKLEQFPKTWVECLAENDRLRTVVDGIDGQVERRTKSLLNDNEELSSTIKEFRSALQNALTSLKRPECSLCEGTGGEENWVDYTTRDSWEPDERLEGWTDPDDEACGDCLGTGLEVI